MALCYHLLPIWNCENPGKNGIDMSFLSTHLVQPKHRPCESDHNHLRTLNLTRFM